MGLITGSGWQTSTDWSRHMTHGLHSPIVRSRPSRGQCCAASGGPSPCGSVPPGSLSRPSDWFGSWSVPRAGRALDPPTRPPHCGPSYFEAAGSPQGRVGVPPRASFVNQVRDRQGTTDVPASPGPGLPGARRLRRPCRLAQRLAPHSGSGGPGVCRALRVVRRAWRPWRPQAGLSGTRAAS